MGAAPPAVERTIWSVALFLTAVSVAVSTLALFNAVTPIDRGAPAQERVDGIYPAVEERLYCDWFGNSTPPQLRPGISCRSNLYPGYANVTYVETGPDGFRYGSLSGQDGRRIAVLGDGVAFGLGVPVGDSFPALLDARLLDATVVTAAAPWYGIADSYRAAERLTNSTDIDLILLPLELEDAVGAADYRRYLREAGQRFPETSLRERHRIADVALHDRVEAVPARIGANGSVLGRYLDRFRALERRTGARVLVFSVRDSRYVPELVRGAGLRYIGQPWALEGAYRDHRLAAEEPYLDAGGHRVVARFLERQLDQGW